MNFPYVYELKSLDSLEIEDTGNVTIKCFNDIGYVFYLKIETDLGWTTVKQFGPIILDTFKDSYNYSYSYSRKEYNEKNIKKLIDTFLNDSKRFITQAFIITPEEFDSKLKEMPL